jgi:hypothetical protein
MHDWNNPKACELVKKYAPSTGCDRASIVIPLPKSQKDCLMQSLFLSSICPAGANFFTVRLGRKAGVLDELDDVDVQKLAIHRRICRLNYSEDVLRPRLCRLILSRAFLWHQDRIPKAEV